MKTIRHNVFETNSSSTHSLVISKEKDYAAPDKNIVIKMRGMEYLYKQDPSYESLPEYSELKKMTTGEVINYILKQYKNDGDDEDYMGYAVDQITDFLDAVGIKKGYRYNSSCWYSDKFETEVVPALDHIKSSVYPSEFNASVYAPENDFKKKLEFLYCMSLARESGEPQVPYKDFSEFFKLVDERASDIVLKIEVPNIEDCDDNTMEYPSSESYEGGWDSPEYRKAYDKYSKWQKSWEANLCKEIIPISEYSIKHYERTLLEIRICGYDYPLYMELHDDCHIEQLREMFKNNKNELIDWLFDNNSGYYRFRNG